MRVLTPLLAAAALAGCFGPHITTGAAPRSPSDTFSCMTSALHDMGFDVTSSEPATGFLKAQKRDLGSPDSAEYTVLTISIYTNRDQETQYMVTAIRKGPAASDDISGGAIETQDSDAKAADELGARCGKK